MKILFTFAIKYFRYMKISFSLINFSSSDGFCSFPL